MDDEREAGSLKKFLDLIRWLNTFIQKQWLIFVLIYFFSSVIFQAGAFWLDKTRYTRIENITRPCFQLNIRLPNEIPLSASNLNGTGRAVTVWGWKTPAKYCASFGDELTIYFSNTRELVFVNQDKVETSTNLLIKLGVNEADAPRYTFYVYSPLTDSKIDQISLNVERGTSLGIVSLEEVPLTTQSEHSYFRMQFLNVFLGTTVFTIISALLAITKFYFDQSEKYKQELASIESDILNLEKRKTDLEIATLDILNKAGQWGFADKIKSRYSSLRVEFDGNIIWTESFRQELVEEIKKSIGAKKDFKKYLSKCKSILGFPDEYEKTLLSFYNILQKEIIQDDDAIGAILRTFRLLGFPSKDLIVTLLNKSQSIITDDRLKYLLEQGRATGWFLIRQIQDEGFQKKVREKENEYPYPPNRLLHHYWLWPHELSFRIDKNTSKKIASMWEQPFGAIKAEEDPRLPPKAFISDQRKTQGLFFDQAPLWGEVSSDASGYYILAPGMGTSTLISMGRWERRFWGIKPSFSVYIHAVGGANMEVFKRSLYQAIADSLILNLVEDPFWFLSASRNEQDSIAGFLRTWYPDLLHFMRILDESGLPGDEHTLVFDAFRTKWQTNPRPIDLYKLFRDIQRCMAKSCGARLKPNASFKIFFWIEIADEIFAEGWMKKFTHVGLLNLGTIKLFVKSQRAQKSNVAFKQNELRLNVLSLARWDREQLSGLLNYRLAKTKWDERSWGYSIPVTKDQLIEQAEGSPQCLIMLGNDLLTRE